MGSLANLEQLLAREVVVSKHAGVRISERLSDSDLDHVRAEVRAAFLCGRVEMRTRRIRRCYSASGEWFYVVAVLGDRIVVITVCRTAPIAAVG